MEWFACRGKEHCISPLWNTAPQVLWMSIVALTFLWITMDLVQLVNQICSWQRISSRSGCCHLLDRTWRHQILGKNQLGKNVVIFCISPAQSTAQLEATHEGKDLSLQTALCHCRQCPVVCSLLLLKVDQPCQKWVLTGLFSGVRINWWTETCMWFWWMKVISGFSRLVPAPCHTV